MSHFPYTRRTARLRTFVCSVKLYIHATQKWGGQFAIKPKSMRKVRWIMQTILPVYSSLIGKSSRRRPSMVGIDLSPFWPHSVCQFRLNRRARILVPNMAAYNPLSQAVGAETVSLNSPPTLQQIQQILTTLQHHSRALHGSHLCHGLFPILPLLPACRLF